MRKRTYEPPVARDLSCLRASGSGFLSGGGGTVLGICDNGTAVTGATCVNGVRVDGVGSCSPYGYKVNVANYCEGGFNGSSGCTTGSLALT